MINVALNKPITTTGSLTNLSRVTNGDKNTANFYDAGGGAHSVTIDLQTVYTLERVTLYHYYGDSRIYNGTKTEISQDGITWKTIYDNAVSGKYTETSSGKTIYFSPQPVRYIRDSANGSNINTYSHWVEIEAYEYQPDYSKKIIIEFDKDLTTVNGSEGAFAVTGKQYDCVGGILVNKTYTVTLIKASVINPKVIEIYINPYSRFNNVDGNITVSYSQALGTLGNNDGKVQDFSISFQPTNLTLVPNPNQKERITLRPVTTFTLKYINKPNRYSPSERITLRPSNFTITFRNIITDPL